MTEQKFVPVETGTLQLQALESFANHIGFHLDDNNRTFVRETKDRILRSAVRLSGDSMVRLYNNTEDSKWATVGAYTMFSLNLAENGQQVLIPFFTKDLQAAYDGQSFETVKLRFTKEGIVVLDDNLSFYDPEDAADFLAAVDLLNSGLDLSPEIEEVPSTQGVTGILENWMVTPYNPGKVSGDLYGDSRSRFADGTFVTTSALKPDQVLKQGSVIQTANSSYLLGTPSLEGELLDALLSTNAQSFTPAAV